jgi:hypothetical protein
VLDLVQDYFYYDSYYVQVHFDWAIPESHAFIVLFTSVCRPCDKLRRPSNEHIGALYLIVLYMTGMSQCWRWYKVRENYSKQDKRLDVNASIDDN